MNAADRAAIMDGIARYDDVMSRVDDRTLEILDRRRRIAAMRRRGWLVRRLLLTADLSGLLLALLLAEWFVNRRSNLGTFGVRDEILVFCATLPLWVVVTKVYGLYDHDEQRTDHSTADDLSGVFHMVTVCTWLFAMGSYLTGVADPKALKLVIFWAAATVAICAGRALARAVVRRQVTYLQNTVIVGAGSVGQLVAKKLLQHHEYGLNLVGFVDAQPLEPAEGLDSLALLGGPDRLPAIVRAFDVERVIIAFSNDRSEETLDLIRSLKDLEVQIDIVPRFFELLSPGIEMHTIEGVPLLGLPPLRLSRSSRLLKRAMDLALALAGLVVLSPVFLTIAIAIKVESAGPIFFRQERMGSRGRTFRIFKFRSMAEDADRQKADVAHLNKHLRPGGDARMFKIDDDPRTTRVGRALRRLSLDELPQLFNVVLGHMSLVGPRPLILDEDKFVEAWARRRLDLRPGITGIWQVLGRDGIGFDEMVRFDYLYVTTWSLGRDLRLILRTIPRLVAYGR